MARTSIEVSSSSAADSSGKERRSSMASAASSGHERAVRASSYSADRLSRPTARDLTSNKQQAGEEIDDAREDTFEDAQDSTSLQSCAVTGNTDGATSTDRLAANGDKESVYEEESKQEKNDDINGDNDGSDNNDDREREHDEMSSDDHPADQETLQFNSEDDDTSKEDGIDSVGIPNSNRSSTRYSAHSVSGTSNMENVTLEDDVVDANDATNQATTTAATLVSVSAAAGDGTPTTGSASGSKPPYHKAPAKTLSLGSFTSALPSLSWGSSQPPISTPDAATKSPSVASTTTTTQRGPAAVAVPFASSAVPPPMSRKISSPFSWLSRASTTRETAPPAQLAPRRNTASSMATMTSNPELMLGRLADDKDAESTVSFNSTRSSLKDRFQQLRLQSEVGTTTDSPLPLGGEDAFPVAVSSLSRTLTGLSLGLVSPPNENEEDKDSSLSTIKTSLSPVPPSPNPSLAPGTAVGIESGPSAMSEGNVDWDLWQSVVYEGPAAVARSSAEELNRAIASGIPSAIRGVIWQVLAQSKNEELEQVYRDLSARGTDKAKDRRSHSTTASTVSNSQLSVQSDVVQPASSVSSMVSDAGDKMPEAVLKAQAAADAERKRKDLVDVASIQKLEKTIRRDMGTRTSYSKYAASEGLQEGLFGVCKAYALFDEEVSYAQGMNFLVMPLLFNMPEDEAFCLLVRLMNHYGLRELFVNDMPGLHMRLYQFERLLEDFEPAVYCHLHRRNISPHLYATQWFLTLFAYRFPLQLVLRIYDLIFSEGLSAILRFGLVLMQKNAAALLAMNDMQQLTTFLKDKVFDVYIDKTPSAGSLLENGFFGSSSSSLDKEVYHADQMVRDACEIRITPHMLKAYTVGWEEKTRAHKEREAEMETLRASNLHYAQRLRKLEERIEAVDREQAALATELVHFKLENQELADENESLRGQVRELRIVIEKQPAELEQAWLAERDDLIKRNSHVHEENEKLESAMAALEEDLVKTKMSWAELNEQHDELKGKWAELKKQFA